MIRALRTLPLYFLVTACAAEQAPPQPSAGARLPANASPLELDPASWPEGRFHALSLEAADAPMPPALTRLLDGGHRVSVEPRLGLPTFLWVTAGTRQRQATGDGSSSSPASAGVLQGGGISVVNDSPATVARRHLWEHASLYRLSDAALESADVDHVHDLGVGAILVRFRQRVGDLPVFGERMTVAMNRQLEAVAISGYLHPHAHGEATPRFRVGSEAAVRAAFADLTGVSLSAGALTPAGRDEAGMERFELPEVEGFEPFGAVRARQVAFVLPDGVHPAWHIEVSATGAGGPLANAYVISARDGRLLVRAPLLHDIKYRVWADAETGRPFDSPQGNFYTPHPTGKPDLTEAPYAEHQLVEILSGLNANEDPWLPADAVDSVGNNVNAYADISGQDGFGAGDIRAEMTEPGVFGHAFDPTRSPQADDAQIMGAIQELFYVNNWLHDAFYDYGFDEEAGNAQRDNYGRGGAGGDTLLVEGQDQGGLNNANMLTPFDGASPKMQMYLYDFANRTRLEVTSPAAIAGEVAMQAASFNPEGSFDIAAPVVAADDGDDEGGDGSTEDACQAPTTDVAGKIALVRRGQCEFAQKVRNMQDAGAVAVLVSHNDPSEPDFLMAMGGNGGGLTIPAFFVRYTTDELLREALATDVVEVGLKTLPLRDGTVDHQVVQHEWAHYLFGRLVGAANSSTNQTGGINEGNGDFVALLLAAGADDVDVPGNDRYQGAYPVFTYTASYSYFGGRRMPYSTSPDINPLTFAHISDAESIPDHVPMIPTGASNAEVHNAGEVWANTLWGCYAALLNAHGAEEGRHRMMADLVVALQLFPADATWVEARDAFLAAAVARDTGDFTGYWGAFSDRGLGVAAEAPDRFSLDNADLVDSFDLGGHIVVDDVTLIPSADSCDKDAYLDRGETGVLRVTLSNTGAFPLEGPEVRVAALSSTVSLPRPGVAFPEGDTVTVGEVPVLGTVTAEIPVTLIEAIPYDALHFDIHLSDAAAPFPVTVGRQMLANLDEVVESSTEDSIEGAGTVWEPAVGPNNELEHGWERVTIEGREHRWYGPANGFASDVYLMTPALEVSTDAKLVVAWEHRYRFEYDAGSSEAFDGGVIEVSVDDGVSWEDAGGGAEPGYDGTVTNLAREHGAQPQDNNPLSDRAAFTGRSPDWPAMTKVSLSLGSTYVGKTIRLRFRVATDPAVGAEGWEIDNVSISGIDNTPFSTLQPDAGTCRPRPVADAGKAQSVEAGVVVTLDGSASRATDAGDVLTYSWVQIAGPGVTLGQYDTATPTWTAPELAEETTITFRLMVADSTGLSEPSEVSIKVAAAEVVAADGGSDTTSSATADDGCSLQGGSGSAIAVVLGLGLVLLALRRRRQAC